MLGTMFSLNEAFFAFISCHPAFVATILVSNNQCVVWGLEALRLR